jgi:ribosomal protein S18 acetylase RimI-like enzyme
MNAERPQWRAMNEADLAALMAVADIVHPNYPEDPAVFAERLHLYPAGCLVLERGGKPIGYILSHPWHFGQPPALNSLLSTLPEAAGTYYIHDIALLPEARGTGSVTPLIERLVATARAGGFPNISLVAVNGSASMWARYGFTSVVDPGLEAKLRSYDDDARFMVRRLGPRSGRPT